MHCPVRLSTIALCGLCSLPALAAPTHCLPTEQVVFRCELGAKRVAVCASADLAATGGQLQYRFGRPGAAELVHPAADADWRLVTTGNVLTFSGGGGAYLAFQRQTYRYVVFTAIGQGWGQRAGVVVERDGRRIAQLRCTSAPESLIGPDLFERAGIAADARGFDLP